MNANQFIKWLKAMDDAKIAHTDAACGRMLGVSADTIVRMKKDGTDLKTALACRALLHRMQPYE